MRTVPGSREGHGGFSLTDGTGAPPRVARSSHARASRVAGAPEGAPICEGRRWGPAFGAHQQRTGPHLPSGSRARRKAGNPVRLGRPNPGRAPSPPRSPGRHLDPQVSGLHPAAERDQHHDTAARLPGAFGAAARGAARVSPRSARTRVPAPARRDRFVAEKYEGYCVKCKEKREFDGEVRVSESGRRMAQGTCPVCGTKMNRILGKA